MTAITRASHTNCQLLPTLLREWWASLLPGERHEQQGYDVGIIASHDTDLMPALEMVHDLELAHVEVSGWARRNRLWYPGTKLPWHHSLGEGDYQQVCDDTDYLKDR